MRSCTLSAERQALLLLDHTAVLLSQLSIPYWKRFFIG